MVEDPAPERGGPESDRDAGTPLGPLPSLPAAESAIGGRVPFPAAGGSWAASSWRRAANRFRRLGLQRRIMLYVTVGLSVMFGVLALLGLRAIDQATNLVFQERLSTAYTTAGLPEQDFARLARDVGEATRQPPPGSSGAARVESAQELLDYFERVGPSPFFQVSGVWFLDAQGGLVDEAGSPSLAGTTAGLGTGRVVVGALKGQYAVLRALGPVPGGLPFAAEAVRADATSVGGPPVVVIHTVSINSRTDYVPAGYGPPGPSATPVASPPTAAEAYHLEVVDSSGIAVLGVGSDDRPGQLSKHYLAIKSLMAQGSAAALLHEPGPADTFAPHVMAVVPLPYSPFYVVLEQPIDIALALPLQLRQQLILTTALGFLAALGVAWVTTRHVVKPTEQLTRAAERMAQGDLATPIDINAEDEVGKLAESLDAMRQRLKAAYEATERTNRELEQRVAERTARLGRVLRQTIGAQEDERRRLARELHDETAQTLAALSIALDRARDELAGAPPEAAERIREAKAIEARLLAETRRLIAGLRPTVLDDMGLLPAIRWYSETVLSDKGVAVEIDAEQAPPRLPIHIETALYRIMQEAVSNVAKHAGARHVAIHLGFGDGTVTLSVTDDGRGFDVARAQGQSGSGPESVGLIGMQERVRLLNGQLEIRSSEGHGTTVVVRAPMAEEAA